MSDSKLLSEQELVDTIYDITQTMFVTLSEWQAGVAINWESAKIKGRRELLELILADRQVAIREALQSKALLDLEDLEKSNAIHDLPLSYVRPLKYKLEIEASHE